jgi:anti-anti-sigma factor
MHPSPRIFVDVCPDSTPGKRAAVIGDGEPTLRIEIDQDPAGVRLMAHGDIDLHTAPTLSQHLTEAAALGVRRIALDCSAVDFVDSAGLRALLVAHSDLRANDVKLVVVRPSPMVARVLEITRLDDALGVEV